jgi:release factor glutamine methyltransferase
MVAYAETHINGDEKILDIGTGSGCIAVYLAKRFPDAEINAIDISQDAIDLAKENAENYKLKNVHFYKADIFKQIPIKKYDIIISNPPYITTNEINELDDNVRLYEPYNALDGGKKGVTFYEFIASILMKILSQNGKFFLEFGHGQVDAIREIFNNFEYKIEKDINGIERFIFGKFI